jgi:anti-anti-sigma factor
MSFDDGAQQAGVGDRHRLLKGRGRPVPSVVHPHFWLAITRALGTVVVTIHGRLDRTASRQLDGVLTDLIDGQGNLDVVADLWDVKAIEGDSLAVFESAVAGARSRGGRLRLARPPLGVRQLLESMGLTTLEPEPGSRIRRALGPSTSA